MKLLIIFLLSLSPTPSPNWLYDFDQAKKEAHQSGKPILISFSGSDWCSHCMMMKKTIFETPAFVEFASQKLVLVKADFPRKKKNKLKADQVARNEKLAAQYNRTGAFPVTVLVDADGKVMKTWEGVPATSCEGFTADISKTIDAHRK